MEEITIGRTVVLIIPGKEKTFHQFYRRLDNSVGEIESLSVQFRAPFSVSDEKNAALAFFQKMSEIFAGQDGFVNTGMKLS